MPGFNHQGKYGKTKPQMVRIIITEYKPSGRSSTRAYKRSISWAMPKDSEKHLAVMSILAPNYHLSKEEND